MSYAAQTPQRPLPGAYVQTPGAIRYQTGPSRPSFPRTASNQSFQQPQNALQQPRQPSQQQSGQVAPAPTTETISPIARASRTVNETLDQESKYPELDTYLGRGYICLRYEIAADMFKRAYHPNTMSRLKPQGRRFRKPRCTPYRIRYSSSTIAPKFPQ